MGSSAEKVATYEDLLAVPDHLVAEIIHGSLITHPRPASKHALAATALTGDLFNPFQRGRGGPGGWWVLVEPELHLHGDILVPDLAGWRRERMPEFPDTPSFDLAPDWVCEILSPSTQRDDRIDKMPIYAREGVGHLWLIDPILRTLEVYRLHEGHWLLLESRQGEDRVNAEPFDAVTLELSGWWPDGETTEV